MCAIAGTLYYQLSTVHIDSGVGGLLEAAGAGRFDLPGTVLMAGGWGRHGELSFG